MSIDLSLNLSQEQKLIMTQQMQLSLKVLQMSSLELMEYVENELQENPVLEVEETKAESAQEFQEVINYKELLKYLEFDNYGSRSVEKDDSEEISPFNFISEKKELKDYLREQLSELSIKEKTKKLCEYIIDNLDERGFLDISLEVISEDTETSIISVGEALTLVQSLEPAGIGARDLKECLKIQVSRKDIEDEFLTLIIDNYLEYIADNKYSHIAKELNISLSKAQQYGDFIKTLEPRPSRGFYDGEPVKYIQPDAFVKNIDGSNFIIMNEDLLPRLNINNMYKQVVNDEANKEAQDYVKEKINNAMFLIKSIESRKSTLYRVLEKILDIQQDYFNYGVGHLKTMTQNEIASALGMHESTISRTIKDKYIYTSKGMVKIKDLFTVGVSSASSYENVSSKTIKNEIKKLVDQENKAKPLSDQDICDKLNKSGINISRRTVAKYREEMGIRGSSKRKRY